MRRRPPGSVRLALAGIVLGALLPACGSGGGPDDGRLSVVASFYPLVDAARGVGGERVEVANLTPAGVEPHDIELNPRQLDRVEDADLVLFLGGGFQPAVEDAVRRASKSVDLGAELSGAVPGDPHVWLDPQLFSQVVDRVATALVEVDPAGTDAYQEGAADYRRRLAELDAEFGAAWRTASGGRSSPPTTPSATSPAATASSTWPSPASPPTPSPTPGDWPSWPTPCAPVG